MGMAHQQLSSICSFSKYSENTKYVKSCFDNKFLGVAQYIVTKVIRLEGGTKTNTE